MESISYEIFLMLFALACLAGFLDTIAGGGGLITLPALMLCGVPPVAALGTNKLQGTIGTATASFHMQRTGKIRWQELRLPWIAAFLGSALGGIAIQFVDPKLLSFIIPIVLFGIALYFLLSPQIGAQDREPKLAEQPYHFGVIPSIGFYDGAFGPGAGSFLSLAGVYCRGKNLHQATAIAKPLNFATNLGALLVFLTAGQVVWLIGLVMMAGQVIGAGIGARSLFNIPIVLLRALVVLMCTAMLIRYFMTQFS